MSRSEPVPGQTNIHCQPTGIRSVRSAYPIEGAAALGFRHAASDLWRYGVSLCNNHIGEFTVS